MNSVDPGYIYLVISEIVFFGILGCLTGYTTIMDAVPNPRPALLWITALSFGVFFSVMISLNPRLLMFLMQIKPYFLVLAGIAFGFYFNRYNERVSGKKRSAAKVLLTYLASIAGLIFLNVLTYSTALLLIYLRIS